MLIADGLERRRLSRISVGAPASARRLEDLLLDLVEVEEQHELLARRVVDHGRERVTVAEVSVAASLPA